MIIFGINDSSHDASISVVEDGRILFAAHSERYNREKNTYRICPEVLDEAFEFGVPDIVAYYERRPRKKLRKFLFGGVNGDYKNLYSKIHGDFARIREIQVPHHKSHAAAGYYTSTFKEATIVVIDAIGEFETSSVWSASGSEITKIRDIRYPVSFGLFYSAFTHLVGLRPGFEEYILMGMAAFGDRYRYLDTVDRMFPHFSWQPKSFHKGVSGWPDEIRDDQDKFDIAAAAQLVYERRLMEFMADVRSRSGTGNLVFMGGCALNCSANTKLYEIWDNVWIMPNPGDAGSSLGAALSLFREHVEWSGPYLGHNIEGEYPVDPLLDCLLRDKIAAVAVGRAEFGPRALGNRSLLADPRDPQIKDIVNRVKKREPFRPFAPIVMAEHARDWFAIQGESPYMQFAVKCKKPHLIPSVVHADGTSRVQTVNRTQHPGLYLLLEKWHQATGVPVLLNTSLNIKNQPLLNSREDALEWARLHPDVKIFSGN